MNVQTICLRDEIVESFDQFRLHDDIADNVLRCNQYKFILGFMKKASPSENVGYVKNFHILSENLVMESTFFPRKCKISHRTWSCL